MRATTKKYVQNAMYKQEYNMVFTDSALWAGLVVDLPCPPVCVSVTLRHLSHVTCHMSPITCGVSHTVLLSQLKCK